jgi:epoxyqueuosine reductase
VCPYNSPKYNHVTSDENFYPSATALPLTKGEYPQGEGVLHLESITEDDFNTIFADSPVKRTKFSGWKRNLEKLKT